MIFFIQNTFSGISQNFKNYKVNFKYSLKFEKKIDKNNHSTHILNREITLVTNAKSNEEFLSF